MKRISLKKAYKNSVTFVRDVEVAIINEARSFIKGFYNHFESVVILGLSSIGLSALIGELPFYATLPMWIESPMVIPVFSVLIIVALIKLSELRRNRREPMVVTVGF